MQHNDGIIADGFNPTFLYTWKGVRTTDEAWYHSHDHLELAFIMSGRGKYRIDDVIYEVEEGDLLVLNPGTKHEGIVSEPSHPTFEFFIAASDFCFEGMEPNCMVLQQMPVYKPGPDLKQKLMRLAALMGSENEMCRVGRYYMMQSYLIQFMLHILREEQKAHVPGSKYSFDYVNKNEMVEQIISYFEEHYAEKISLDIISDTMYVSPFYISKLFKVVTGDTPIRYLINIRLDRAKELLETTPGISIAEVAERVGYEDAYHFSKLFKKRFGVSPSKIKVC